MLNPILQLNLKLFSCNG